MTRSSGPDRRASAHQARSHGLPGPIADFIAGVVASTGLPPACRDEVFDELVSHFHDGLATGLSPEDLLTAFGDGSASATQIGQTKTVLTPVSRGGPAVAPGLLPVLRQSLARLWATPAFTLAAVLLLSIGIGTSATTFAVVNDVILRRPPIAHPERLVDLYDTPADGTADGLSEPEIADLRQLTSLFTGVASTRMTWIWHESTTTTTQLTGEAVSSDYFQVLGLEPLHGRFFTPLDAPTPGQGAVVVLGERTWRTAFQADTTLIGRAIRLNGAEYQVLGVARADYPGRLRAFPTDIFVPVMMIDALEGTVPSQLLDRSNGGSFATFRLQPGVTLAQAEAGLASRTSALSVSEGTGASPARTITLIPHNRLIIDPAVDRVIRPAAVFVLLVAGLVLVVACTTLAGLCLTRRTSRGEDTTLLLAAGVPRWRLIVPALVETTLIGLTSGLLGTLAGRASLHALLESGIPFPLPLALQLRLDWRVVLFTVTVSLVAGITSGLMSALQSTRSPDGDESDGRARRGPGSLGQLLVGGHVALAMTLVVMAAVFTRRYDMIRRIDPGFGSAPGLLVWVSGRPDSSVGVRDRLVSSAARIPGVHAVGLTSLPHLHPMLGSQPVDATIQDPTAPGGSLRITVDAAGIDSGFVNAMGLRLIAGSNIGPAEPDISPATVLVNQAFVDQHYSGRIPLGERLEIHGRQVTIAGVVNTAKIRSLDEMPRPFIYYHDRTAMEWLVLRTAGDPSAILQAIREAVRATDSGLFVAQISTPNHFLHSQTFPLKLGALALTITAALAMLMASIAIYGTTRHEAGLAAHSHATRAGEGKGVSLAGFLRGTDLRAVWVGTATGGVLALAIGGLVSGPVPSIRAIDLVTLITTLTACLSLVLATAYLGARRAGTMVSTGSQ